MRLSLVILACSVHLAWAGPSWSESISQESVSSMHSSEGRYESNHWNQDEQLQNKKPTPDELGCKKDAKKLWLDGDAPQTPKPLNPSWSAPPTMTASKNARNTNTRTPAPKWRLVTRRNFRPYATTSRSANRLESMATTARQLGVTWTVPWLHSSVKSAKGTTGNDATIQAARSILIEFTNKVAGALNCKG